jgi:hypothetical protein
MSGVSSVILGRAQREPGIQPLQAFRRSGSQGAPPSSRDALLDPGFGPALRGRPRMTIDLEGTATCP